ncbi:MAG TPA: carboxypeptidase regulatory-like domain-containing protein [Iamia sp.]
MAALAGLAAVLVVGAQPAAAATPVLAIFTPETIAVMGEQNPPAKVDQIRATAVIRHDVGVTVTGMKGWHSRASAPASYTSVASYGGTVRTISGGSNYSIVEASFDPGPDNWMGSSCGTVRTRDVTARMDFQMSDGTTFTDNTWTVRALAINGCGGPEDPATMENNYDSTQNVVVLPGNSFRTHYICDDGDSSGDADACDNVIISLRNAATGSRVILQCDTSTVPCENARQFNADDNTERNGTVPVPAGLAQGRWLVEGDFCAETQRNAALTECLSGGNNINIGRQQIGSFYYNPGAPTVSVAATSFSGGGNTVGGVIRPNTGATVNYTATTSSDAQVASWDLDGNGSFETVNRGETNPQAAPVLSAAQKVGSRNTSALAAGSSCAVGISVRDNGGINAADPSSSTATASSATCRVNTPPAGANQGPTNATKGTALPITLANTDTVDGDARTCEQVGAAGKGTVTGFPSCSVSYTANASEYGSDSFTYRVRDDHDGVSATYTVSLAIQNQAPTATAQSVAVDAGAPTAITLAGTDPDGDSLTCSTTSSPTKGDLTGSGCARTYTSDPGVGGADGFAFTVADGAPATSSAASVDVTIANPDLSLTKTHTGRFNEGTGTGTYTLTVANSATAPANGTTTLVDTLPAGMVFRSANVGSSGFTCTATAGVSTTVSCTRSTAIPVSTSVALTITVDVAAGAASPVSNTATVSSLYELASTAGNNTATDPTDVNHRPTGAPQTVSTAVDASVTVTFAGNDPDGDALTFAASDPAHGSVTGSGASQQYTPDPGFQGIDTFTYTATDTGTPGLVSSAHTVTVYVGVSELVGVVTDEVTGLPLAGVEARLVNMADPQAEVLAATVVTDAAGAYDFGAMPHGTYGIRFVDPTNDHIAEWFDDAPTSATANLVTLDASARSATRSVSLRPAARVTGTVRSTSVPHAPIEGLQVRLVKVGSSSARTTNSGGHYGFDLLQPGTYQLWFRDVSSGQWVSEWYSNSANQASSSTIEVAVGEQVTIDEQLTPVAPPPPPDSGSVTGTVTDATSGAPLAGVQVRLYRAPYTGSTSTTTDVNGQYSFTRLPPGTYKLWFRDMTGTRISEYGGDASTLNDAETLSVANTGHVEDASLALKVTPPPPPANSGVVSGTVTEIDGFTPIAGINVRLYPVGGTTSKSTTTGADGSYSFIKLVPGQYQVVFRDTTGTWFNEWHLNAPTQAASTAVTVTNGLTTDVDASLNRR